MNRRRPWIIWADPLIPMWLTVILLAVLIAVEFIT
jgi:hypothetical protein